MNQKKEAKTMMNINILIKKVLEADQAYYSSGHAIMSDTEYDALKDAIKAQDPNHPVLSKVGHEPSQAWRKAQHEIHMGSLNKCHTLEDFNKWASGFPAGTLFIIQPKYDGLSLSLSYNHGRLERAVTRGDGFEGEDITENVRLMGGLINKASERLHGSVRCEIMLEKGTFDKINSIIPEKDRYKNPRNAASGISRRLDGLFCNHLKLISYDLLFIPDDLATEAESLDEDKKIEALKGFGFNVPEIRIGDIDYVIQMYGKLKNLRDSLSFGIDGSVIKVCSWKAQVESGMVNNRPKAQIAWKFDPPGAITILNSVSWEVGRTGVVTPLGHVEPAEIDGSTVSNVTLHNVAEIRRLGIGLGDTVTLVKSGDIIPKILSVIEHKDRPIVIPTHCPDCGALLENNNIQIFCRNGGCSSRTFFRIMNWIKVVTIDDLGEALVDRLFNAGPEREGKLIVKCIADLYCLTVDDIASVEGWGEKSATTIINNINKTRRLEPAKFLAAVGIPGISHKTAEDLIKAFKTVEGVLKATKEQISPLKGYSGVSSDEITQGLHLYENEIRKLLEIIDLSPEDNAILGKLSGKTFCFTGAMDRPRSEYQDMVTTVGGKNLSTVTKDLTYLVCNDDRGSSKSQKAKKYGTKIISEKEFLGMIGDLPVKPVEPTFITNNIFSSGT